MKIRCAVIGAGFIGLDHVKAYKSWPDAEVVAVAETNAVRADELARTFGIRAYGDYESLLASEDVQAVSICVPTGLHLPVALAAAKAGKHILLEKPMARTVSECDAIREACQSSGVKLMLGFTHRFHSELRLAKRMIAEGQLGQVLLASDLFSFGEEKPWPDWYYSRELGGGGEMMHDAVHCVDRLAWLIGSPIDEVYGRTSAYARNISGVEDGGAACLVFANGAIASLFVNQSTFPLPSDSPRVPMPGRMELELHGTRGSLRYNTWQSLQFSNAGQAFTLTRQRSDEMAQEIREFLDAILENRQPIVGGAEGRQGIAVIQALYESERRHAPVQVAEMLAPHP